MNTRTAPVLPVGLFQLQDATGTWHEWPVEFPREEMRAEALALAACELMRGTVRETEFGYRIVTESGERWGSWQSLSFGEFVRLRRTGEFAFDISRVHLRRRTVRDEGDAAESDWAGWRCHPDAGWFARMALLWLGSGQERFRMRESECYDGEYSLYTDTETEVEEMPEPAATESANAFLVERERRARWVKEHQEPAAARMEGSEGIEFSRSSAMESILPSANSTSAQAAKNGSPLLVILAIVSLLILLVRVILR